MWSKRAKVYPKLAAELSTAVHVTLAWVMKHTEVKGSWTLPLRFRRGTEVRCVACMVPTWQFWGAVLWSYESTACIELETSRCWPCLSHRISTKEPVQAREACCRQKSHLSPLTSDMEQQELELALLGFSIALTQCFLAFVHGLFSLGKTILIRKEKDLSCLISQAIPSWFWWFRYVTLLVVALCSLLYTLQG